ncbi:hypothetical protein H0Z60_08500 [Ectothiorhodospiraceae bacterium WFHF3C12]|nr:hypothetical protein [Ectothiorhodospiraceae bacterium WFHF3C12]
MGKSNYSRRTLGVVLTSALLTAGLAGCGGNSSSGSSVEPLHIQEAYLNEQAGQIGGDTTATARFTDDSGTDWTVFNVANHLSLTPVQVTKGAVSRVSLDEYIHDIELVESGGVRYALVALGGAGVAVVDISSPTAPTLLHTVPVNYYQDGITFAEGGGGLVEDAVIEGTNGPVVALATDGTTLWIGNEAYGIQRTALSNVLGTTPVTEADGTLQIDSEVYTLQFAGEHPWGGPEDLQLHDGNLYAAQGFLGVGVFNPDTLAKVGYYNMYTDTSVTEDWFVDMDVATEVQTGNLDPETGMPNYDQASFEILEVWHGDTDAPTPWANFDRYGKYYYDARSLDVADFGTDTRVFVAYGLGGLVALDANDPTSLSYLGYAPAVPAHGPDAPTGQQSQSLFPYFGAGMLKEAGTVDVMADPANDRVFYSDHFAGLVILDGASDPAANWQQAGAPYDNDTIGDLGDHWPDYEFVTSYDMGDYDPEDNESLPVWMYEAPSLLVTGEISGHGNAFELMPTIDPATGNVDVIMANGSGGMDFLDLGDLGQADLADRFSVPVHFATTDEVGAAADGTATADVSIGHTQGVATTDQYLYVSDGPHGMSVWRIADDAGSPVDDVHLVANTLMEEYPEDAGGTTVYPTPHAYNNVLQPENGLAFVMSQSLGMRRVDISGAEAGNGVPGAPLLLTPQPSDFYEHNTASGSVGGISRQDHVYDVDFHGDYAVVADGSNGLTVYDLTVDPTLGGAHVVANLGSESGRPGLGRTSGVELWTNSDNGRVYAFVAAGHAGVGVVDMTGLLVDGDPDGMELVKLFEPIKLELEDDGTLHVGKADSRSIDVDIVGDHVYYSYGGFGLLAYSIEDMLAPLPDGIAPDNIWEMHDYDYRPEAVGAYRMQDEPGMEGSDPEALYMTPQYFPADRLLIDDNGEWYVLDEPRLLFYVAYGAEGVAKIDWSDPANPTLMQHQDTVGEATGTAIAHGRVYVSDHEGGLVFFR